MVDQEQNRELFVVSFW